MLWVRLLTSIFFLLATTMICAASSPDTYDTDLFSPDGYRIDRYRSPTPETIDAVETVQTAELQALITRTPTPIIIDVINSEYRASRFIESRAHHSIPGAHWLPNTGRGQLDEKWHAYLLDNALRLTANDRNHPVVVMCKSDCWLSWNAARRLKRAGFTRLYWYRDGIDAWQEAGLAVEVATPVPPDF